MMPPRLKEPCKATLRTRCGCTREMFIEYPPKPEIKLPMNRTTNALLHFGTTGDTLLHVEVRIFNLVSSVRNGIGLFHTAEYLEQ